MWHTGRPAADQCEGCTFNTGHVLELSYLHSRLAAPTTSAPPGAERMAALEEECSRYVLG
jgi:hypothetical protein